MTAVDLVALLPLAALAVGAVVVMLIVAFRRGHRATAAITAAAFVAAGLSLPVALPLTPRRVSMLFVVDTFALFYWALLFAAALAVAILAYGYLVRHDETREELYILLLLATLGGGVLAGSNHFATFFLGLEILSVSLYTLVAYPRLRESSAEAGMKYLVLAATSSAFLLFGMALVYAALGTMEFAGIAALVEAQEAPGELLMAGLGMMVVAVGFKLALAPFHLWIPDVYEGAPAPVTAFVATVSKGAVFALLLRFFAQTDIQRYESLFVALAIIAIASMFVGNVLALLQYNVKRLLAYSSIAHFGYLLVAFLAGGTMALTAATIYLVAYFVTALGAFGVVSVLSTGDRDADHFDDYRGLFWRRPALAVVFTAMLLSLAGLPLTAGFVGKFYVAVAGVGAALWLPVVSLVVASATGVFYYLRLVIAMYLRPAHGKAVAAGPALTVAGGIVLAGLTLLLVLFGVYPSPLIDLIESAVAGLA